MIEALSSKKRGMSLVECLRAHNPEIHPDCHEAAKEIERLTSERAIVVAAMMARIPNAPPVVEALQEFVRQWNACGSNSDFGRYFGKIRDTAVDALAKYQLSGDSTSAVETGEQVPLSPNMPKRERPQKRPDKSGLRYLTELVEYCGLHWQYYSHVLPACLELEDLFEKLANAQDDALRLHHAYCDLKLHEPTSGDVKAEQQHG